MSRTKGATNDKEWRDAVRKSVHKLRDAGEGDKARRVKSLGLLADKLVSTGLDGDVSALKEIGDRLDGKPAQAVDVAMAVQITTIERRIVDPIELVAETVLPAITQQDSDGE